MDAGGGWAAQEEAAGYPYVRSRPELVTSPAGQHPGSWLLPRPKSSTAHQTMEFLQTNKLT